MGNGKSFGFQDETTASYAGQGLAFAEHSPKETTRQRSAASHRGVYLFSASVFIIGFLIGLFASIHALPLWGALLVAVLVGTLGAMSIHITLQWERSVVLRLGKLDRIVGPGVYFTIPVIEYTTLRVDQRMRCTFFAGEQILTEDLVPVDVDAVFYWAVWDPKKACTEVEDYRSAVSRIAQTCMRDVIGSVAIDELATRRRQLDKEIRDEIAVVTEDWGISVTAVKIRNIIIPKDLQDSLSKAAQAQRERDARVILGEVEKDLAEMLVDAANTYDKNDRALQLRAMHIVNESMREKGGMVVVPNSLGDSLGSSADFLKRMGG